MHGYQAPEQKRVSVDLDAAICPLVTGQGSSGYNAHRFKTHAGAGMLGINVGVPAPMAVFPFSGWKDSFYGTTHANGEDAIRFYTEYRVTVSRWI